MKIAIYDQDGNLETKSVELTNLNISYIDNEQGIIFDSLTYFKDNKLDFFADLRKDDMTEKYLSWQTAIDGKDIIIRTGYITKCALIRLSSKRMAPLQIITYETAKNKNKEEFTYDISIKSNNREIDLTIDGIYSSIIEKNDTFTLVKVKNMETDEFEFIHYLDDYLYMVKDIKNNIETINKDNNTIKYEFDRANLNISNYLQYHNPFRITNYTTNKQYIMKYNEYGIMTSMIEISDPETELCEYNNFELSDDSKIYEAIHPDIYNAFDIDDIVAEVSCKRRATECFYKTPIIGHSIYKKTVEMVD